MNGILNSNNNCFISVYLHLLSRLDEFTDNISNCRTFECILSNQELMLFREVEIVFKLLREEEKSVIEIDELVKWLKVFEPKFFNGQQQDCAEVLNWFLTLVHQIEKDNNILVSKG